LFRPELMATTLKEDQNPWPTLAGSDTRQPSPAFLSVKQLAEYLQINEKKIYALANDGRLPGTKITGKWLFPKTLIDQWLLESSHGGILTDRLLITGSEDPLLTRLVTHLIEEFAAQALISYTPTGTSMGLSLLARRRTDICAIHWGPLQESHIRHASLIQQYADSSQWLIVRLFHREQGFMLASGLNINGMSVPEIFRQNWIWAMRSEGTGSQYFLEDTAVSYGIDLASLNTSLQAQTEREVASLLSQAQADIAPGPRSVAREFGLQFIPVGWEGFDLVLPRTIYFRQLFQVLLQQLHSRSVQSIAQQLGGYRFEQAGEIIWSPY
jgi:putative molybdopterin biosynthesis protein